MRGWMTALQLVGIGWLIVVSIALGFFAGLWLDNLLHTSPWIMLLGLLVGVAAAFVGVYRLIVLVFAERDQDGKEDP